MAHEDAYLAHLKDQGVSILNLRDIDDSEREFADEYCRTLNVTLINHSGVGKLPPSLSSRARIAKEQINSGRQQAVRQEAADAVDAAGCTLPVTDTN